MMTPRTGAALAVAADHPAFEGHFPGAPILPAVVLLAEAFAAIEAATGLAVESCELANAKFTSAVAPGTALTLAHEPAATGGVRFEIRSPDALVASGILCPREAP